MSFGGVSCEVTLSHNRYICMIMLLSRLPMLLRQATYVNYVLILNMLLCIDITYVLYCIETTYVLLHVG